MFSGEVAWVTGSSKGIGRAIALDLAEEGCDIVVHYNRGEDEARQVAEEIEARGRTPSRSGATSRTQGT
jgi:3-oxoacyl-[acyl-carrier protein] reductase